MGTERLPGNITGVFDLLGSELVVQFDPETRFLTSAELFFQDADYGPLFDDPALETNFVVLTAIEGDQLLVRDLFRLSLALDLTIFDDATGNDMTAQFGGLAGLIPGEPVRLRIRVGQAGDLFPKDLVVEVGLNPVLDGEPDVTPPDEPLGPGPNAGAIVTADLNFDPLDQQLTNFELTPGDVGQVAIYGYGLTDLAGVSVKLRFDELQLNFDAAAASLDPGDPNILEPLEPFADQPVFLSPTVEEGLLTFAGSLLGQDQTAPRPEGLLAIVQFSPTPEFSGAVVVVEEVTFNDATGANDVVSPAFSLFFVPPLGTRADLDGDGCVLWNDLFLFADAWGGTEFDSRFDFTLDGNLDELDFFVLARAFGTCSSGKLIAAVGEMTARQGTLRLETISDDGLWLLVLADGVETAGSAMVVDYDPHMFRLTNVHGGTHGSGRLLFDEEEEGRVLVLTKGVGLAGGELLARLHFEPLVAEANHFPSSSPFTVREAALRRADGLVVQPDVGAITVVNLLPESFGLAPNYPNPFNSSTTISFQLPVAGAARIEIFDLLGQKIRSLVAGERAAGFHETTWDGRDDSGLLTAAGPYLYRLDVRPADRGRGVDGQREFSEVRRLLFLK